MIFLIEISLWNLKKVSFLFKFKYSKIKIYEFNFLVVKFNYDKLMNWILKISEEQLVDLKVKFQENRASMAPIYIVTPHDFNQTNSTYTREKPTIQNLCRTVLIAKKHLEHLKNCINNFESIDHFKVRLEQQRLTN